MEKRAILAAVLMFGLLMVYQALFTPAPEPDKAAAPKTEQRQQQAAPAPAQPTAPAPAPVPLVPVAAAEAAAPERIGEGRDAPLPRGGIERGGRGARVGAELPRVRSRSWSRTRAAPWASRWSERAARPPSSGSR